MPATEDSGRRRPLRLLVVAPFPPRLDGRHGGSRAVAQLVSDLARRHAVALVVLRADDEPGVDNGLRKACDLVEEVAIPAVGSSVLARLKNRIRLRLALLRGVPTWAAERSAPDFEERLRGLVADWRPDLVQFEYRIMGQFLPAVARSVPALLVDYDPVRSSEGGSVLRASLETRAWNRLASVVARHVDRVVALTERDQAALAELSGSTPVECIPLGYELSDSLDPAGTAPASIVLVGSFIHHPNLDAAFWLSREVFPAVRGRVPQASLQLVGSHAPQAIHALAGRGIEVCADVPDVRAYLDTAAVVAAPIRLGGGMRVKVLEALAAGKAVVATRLAVAGLDVTDGEHVLLAESAGDFADALADLLTDAERRVRIAKAARQWAEQHLDLDRQVEAYDAVYASIARRGTACRAGEELKPSSRTRWRFAESARPANSRLRGDAVAGRDPSKHRRRRRS